MYDQETIKTVLPHRDPFLFCDRILECSPERTVAEVDYGPDRYFFKGHFPGHPVCPGVILVESMAQCGGAGYRLSRLCTLFLDTSYRCPVQRATAAYTVSRPDSPAETVTATSRSWAHDLSLSAGVKFHIGARKR